VGALLSFAEAEDLERLDAFGRSIGLAFQIKDDLLDVESDSKTLGKPAGKDADAGKATFPRALGVEGSRQMLHRTLEEAQDQASALPRKGGRLPALARFIGERRS
jgi:farnesyl diphosphate synthase